MFLLTIRQLELNLELVGTKLELRQIELYLQTLGLSIIFKVISV
jgi:hypothetical protein